MADIVSNEGSKINILSSEESLNQSKEQFQRFVSTSEPSQETLAEGWQLYSEFTWTRLNASDDKLALNPDKATQVAADVRLKLLKGEKVQLTDSYKSAMTAYFHLDTIGIEAGGEIGVLLRDLSGEDLARAKDFCRAMSKVGLK